MSQDKFSARHSFLGYYFQCLYALVVLLQGDDKDKVSIETIDDVTVEGTDIRLSQLKHSLDPKTKLSLKNDGLWGTLLIWSGIVRGDIDGEVSRFFFVTCQGVEATSSLYTLTVQPEKRTKSKLDQVIKDLIQEAQRILMERQAARDAKKAQLPYEGRYKGCEAFLNLKSAERKRLVERMVLYPDSFSIADVQGEVEKLLTSLPQKIRAGVAARLIAWWDGRVAFGLLKENGSSERRITKNELLCKLQDIANELRDGSLPHDYMTQQPGEPLDYDNNIVRQIDLVEGGPGRKNTAIVARWRAQNQRAKWIDADLMNSAALAELDDQLVELWADKWRPVRDDHFDVSDPDVLREVGRGVLDWAHENACQQFVPKNEELRKPYLIRGSLHNLADVFRVGWHPHYPSHFDCPSP